MRKKFLKKYADIFKEKLERGDKVKCPPVRIETKSIKDDSELKKIAG